MKSKKIFKSVIGISVLALVATGISVIIHKIKSDKNCTVEQFDLNEDDNESDFECQTKTEESDGIKHSEKQEINDDELFADDDDVSTDEFDAKKL